MFNVRLTVLLLLHTCCSCDGQWRIIRSLAKAWALLRKMNLAWPLQLPSTVTFIDYSCTGTLPIFHSSMLDAHRVRAILVQLLRQYASARSIYLSAAAVHMCIGVLAGDNIYGPFPNGEQAMWCKQRDWPTLRSWPEEKGDALRDACRKQILLRVQRMHGGVS